MKKDIRIVYMALEGIGDNDIIWGLLELGYDQVSQPDFMITDAAYSEADVNRILDEIASAELVLSKDFSAAVAEACHRRNLPYISWVHDSPQLSLYMQEALYETNFIFVFDKKQLQRLQSLGIPHVFHMPLAANVARTSLLQIEDSDIERFSSDISFVGNLYESAGREHFLSAITPEARAEVESILSGKVGFWDDRHTIFTPISAPTFTSMYDNFNKDGLDLFHMSPEFALQISVIAREAAMRERILSLSALAEQFRVSLYTSRPDYAQTLLPDVNIHGRVNYAEEMPRVFFSSKINLNLTVPSIESGVPLRVLDIMSVGGFVMSNYQEELPELFVPGEDLVLFSDIDDLLAKCDYYLRHEEERVRIALNGYHKVKEKYTYPLALSQIFSTAEKASFSPR